MPFFISDIEMMMLKEIFNGVRFKIIQDSWKLADHSGKPQFLQNWIKKYWSPSAAVNLSGQNSGRQLNDNNLTRDLPFLVAESNLISDLDLSHNQIGERTLRLLTEHPLKTTIRTLNLSHNPLDEAARKLLPRLISSIFTTLNFSHCNLSEQNIDELIAALKRSPKVIALDVSNNQATISQLNEIKQLVARNAAYYTFKHTYQKEDVLDLEKYSLNAIGLKDLAFYISHNAPYFFFLESSVKEIKAPILAKGLKSADFEPLIDALKENNRVTTLTMDFRHVDSETEQKLRTQLMLNKARQNLGSKLGILSYPIMGLIAAQFVTTLIPSFPFALAFLGGVMCRFIYNSYFYHHLQQAKLSDFSQANNAQVIERGKNAANSWLSYLNPMTYTPMAYLGYTIEKDKLSAKYDVKAECFKPKTSQRV